MAHSASATRRVVGRLEAGNVGDQPGGAARLPRVAADLGDRQPGRERYRLLAGLVPGGTGGRSLGELSDDARPVDEQPGDGLAVLVQQPVHGGYRAGGDDGDERARRDHAGDAVADRAARQRGEQVRTGRLPAGDQLRRAPARVRVRACAGARQPKFAAAAPGDVLEPHARLVQPPVEGVKPGRPPDAGPRATALGDHVELRRERREHGRRDVIPCLRVASVGNEACQARGHRNSSPGDTSLQ